MKKMFLTALTVLAFTFVNAQDAKFGRFGVKIGANFAGLDGIGSEVKEVLVSYQIGTYREFGISDKFAIQTEALLSSQGSGYREGGRDYKFNLLYINVPILAKYYVADSFSIEAGPQLGYLLTAKDQGVNVKKDLESFDFGFDLGAGYDFTKNISAGVRYNYGLSKVNKDGDKVSNRVLSLSLGYKF
jgi:opacity protein-like surface antigen